MLFRLLLWNIKGEILKTGLITYSFFWRMRTEAHSHFSFYNEWGLKLCKSTVKVTQWLFVRINSKFKSLFTGNPSCSELLNRSLSHDEFNLIWDHFCKLNQLIHWKDSMIHSRIGHCCISHQHTKVCFSQCSHTKKDTIVRKWTQHFHLLIVHCSINRNMFLTAF